MSNKDPITNTKLQIANWTRSGFSTRDARRETRDVLLSVDVEPWTEAKAAGKRSGREEGEAGLGKTLEALRGLGSKATFFVLGSWARGHKGALRDILAEGHEVASHGYSHQTAGELGPDLFQEEARLSKSLLEDLSGAKVLGYRCPNWGISPLSPWALPALQKAGYRYDASINSGGPYPVISSWPGALEGLRGLDEGGVEGRFEIFVNGAWRLGPWTFPWNLALPLRILPAWFLSWRLGAAKLPSLSLHSWEFNPPSPNQLTGLPALSRAALGYATGESLVRKLGRLLERRKTLPFRAALGYPA